MKSVVMLEPPMTEAQAAQWVTPEERSASQSFTHRNRRREWLAWHAIVRRELGVCVQIAYNSIGAPVLVGTDAFIGISHCAGRVAVCLSDAPCSIDVEPLARDFRRAAPRYMSAAEQELSRDNRLAAAVWCAKECLYKFSGQKQLDSLRDLHIEAVDFEAGTITGRICNGETLRMSMRVEEGFLCVYIM